MATNFLLKRSGTASKRPVAASMALGELDLNYDASTGGIFYKDSAGGVVKVGPAQVGSTAPNASPAGSAGNSVGEFWYDTGASALKIWDGSVWVATGGGGGGGGVTSISGTAPITVNNTNPATPIIGVSAATTSAAGVVRLNDTFTCSSTTQAATTNAARILSSQISGLVSKSTLSAKGDILVGAAASSPAALPVGTDGQILVACSACSLGLTWVPGGGTGTVTSITAGTGLTGGTITASGTIALDTACVIQPTIFQSKGDLLIATAAATPNYLPVGADGEILTACSSTAGGVTWLAPAPPPPPAAATPTAAGIMYGTTSGIGDTALGVSALETSPGLQSVAIGDVALQFLSGGAGGNVAVGYISMRCTTTGEYNTAIGASSLYTSETGSSNVAVGYYALYTATGNGNVAVGSYAGYGYTGNCGIFIGSGAAGVDSTDYQLAITQPGVEWIRGYCDAAVKFGGGIVDAANSCGTAGQVLTSSGANSYNWCSPATGATGTFTSQEGCTITVTNGLITSIV